MMMEQGHAGVAAMETETITVVDPDRAWDAVAGRDGRFDGRLVYAVSTTGVFCRPSCPSRRPHRRHVRFFARPDEARAAGFRPCRRCEPERSLAPALAAMEQVRGHIDAHLDDRLTLAELVSLSRLRFIPGLEAGRLHTQEGT